MRAKNLPVFPIPWVLISDINHPLELKGVLEHVSDLQVLSVCYCKL